MCLMSVLEGQVQDSKQVQWEAGKGHKWSKIAHKQTSKNNLGEKNKNRTRIEPCGIKSNLNNKSKFRVHSWRTQTLKL